eukprot:764448-Hanusia_phi.AAC.2
MQLPPLTDHRRCWDGNTSKPSTHSRSSSRDSLPHLPPRSLPPLAVSSSRLSQRYKEGKFALEKKMVQLVQDGSMREIPEEEENQQARSEGA